jgi:hypothetical protein
MTPLRARDSSIISRHPPEEIATKILWFATDLNLLEAIAAGSKRGLG